MTKPKRRQRQQSETYPAGHFLALVHEHNWPPRFESAMHTVSDPWKSRSLSAMESRERQAVTGTGWGAGTLKDVMGGTPATPKPAWMMRRRAT